MNLVRRALSVGLVASALSALAVSAAAGAPARRPHFAARPPVAKHVMATLSTSVVKRRATASGVPMPVGNLAGWRQVFADDFATNAARGSFARSGYASRWSMYPDGTTDTAGQRGLPSMYEPTKVVSVSHGALDLYLHSAGGKALGAALSPILPGHFNGFSGQRYGRYVVRFRTDALAGYKTAWLLWPDSEVWPGDGEIDFPEGGLKSTIGGYVHHQGARRSNDQAAFVTRTPTAGTWHTAVLQWQPNLVTMTLDGKVIGRDRTRVPSTAMHWVLQTEACQGSSMGRYQACPSASTAGHLQIDWVTVYARQ